MFPGIAVTGARNGSVVLDVLISYESEIDGLTASQMFRDILMNTKPSKTRIMNHLKVKQDERIVFKVSDEKLCGKN